MRASRIPGVAPRAARPLGWIAAVVLFAGCQGSVAAVPSTSLEARVRFLCEIEPPRDAAHPASLDRVADYIAAAFEAAGGAVSRQEFEARGSGYQNVIARFGPSEGARLVIGAHYDVAGELPGADDNASAVAVLIGLAERLGQLDLALPVELVAYSLEEPPHFGTESMGSAVHARSLRAAEVELLGMVSLEMLGYFSDEPGSQEYPLEALREQYGDVANFVALVGRMEDATLAQRLHPAMEEANELAVELLLTPLPFPGIDLSDHRNYWEEDWPALMLTDTSFYRNPHYHEAGDTPETLDYERMEQVLEAVCAAVQALAEE